MVLTVTRSLISSDGRACGLENAMGSVLQHGSTGSFASSLTQRMYSRRCPCHLVNFCLLVSSTNFPRQFAVEC